jgi:hypothetical protein
VKLPPKKPRRKFGDPLPANPLERDIREAIRGAVNRLPWARLWDNQERQTMRGGRVQYEPGLCMGSADLVGIVRRLPEAGVCGCGVFVAIECKKPRTRSKVTDAQAEWLGKVNSLGGVAGTAWTLGMALDIVALARGERLTDVIEELEAIVGRKVDLG